MDSTASQDLCGRKFGRLLAVTPAAGKRVVTAYECKCDCGAVIVTTKYRLLTGHTKSCGCYVRSITAERNVATAKHRMSNTPTYATWRGMVVRCTRPDSKHYASYGGRGISICDRWMTFSNFFEDMGQKPAGMSLDRIDNNGNYEPSNCRWATTREQNQNKRTNKLLTYQGETACAAEWARRAGLSKAGFYDRLGAGMSLEEAICKPSRKGKKSCSK